MRAHILTRRPVRDIGVMIQVWKWKEVLRPSFSKSPEDFLQDLILSYSYLYFCKLQLQLFI
eukprot:scaffold3483_cov124-Skeletonema_marinoi.AAC.2